MRLTRCALARSLRQCQGGAHSDGGEKLVWLAGLPAFIAYFLMALAMSVAYLIVYERITPHPEYALIAKGNAAAAVGQGLSLLGFAIPLASAIYHTHAILECVLWGAIALGVQVTAYFLAGFAQHRLADRIAANDMAAAIWLGCVSLSSGVLSAACMSY